MNIYHIASRTDWVAATRAGQYVAPSFASDGFIHCSTAAQVVPVAEKFYNGQTGLVLLVIDPERLVADLKWEPSAEGAPPPGVPADDSFPHIYGPINLDAVVQIVDFEPAADGNFAPPTLT